MERAACYPSNTFCGPIQGEMKMKSTTTASARPPRAQGHTPGRDSRITADCLRLCTAVYPNTSPPARSPFPVRGSTFNVRGSRFDVQGSPVSGSRSEVQGSRCKVQGSGFAVQPSAELRPAALDHPSPSSPCCSCWHCWPAAAPAHGPSKAAGPSRPTSPPVSSSKPWFRARTRAMPPSKTRRAWKCGPTPCPPAPASNSHRSAPLDTRHSTLCPPLNPQPV